MTHIYAVSGTIFQRNEFMRGYVGYETYTDFNDVRFMAESSDECREKAERHFHIRQGQYIQVYMHRLHIRDLGRLRTRGVISLQTGKPYNCTTLISVPARTIRSAEDEGFIPMRGAMRCEGYWREEWWHCKKHHEGAEWYLDCKVGEEPEARKRGRVALAADQTPDLAKYK